MLKMLSIAASAALCAVAAPAQTPLVYDLVQSSSNFTWSGTSTLGPIVGNPSNAFQLAGTIDLDVVLQAGAQPHASAAFSGGAAAAVPDLHGRINNPIPFLPALATIDVNGLVLSATSPSFAVAPNGAFTASMTLTADAGTLVVTPLGSGPSTTPLAGNSSNPTPVSGTLTLVGGDLRLNTPVNSTFDFMDSTSGASGSITVVGTVVARYPLVRTFCAGDGSGIACPCANNAPAGSGRGCLNSTGVGGLLATTGSPSVGADTLVLVGSGMPANASVLYFQGTTAAGGGAGTLFGDGKRCAAGSVIRLGTETNVAGSSSYPGAGDPLISVRGAVPAAATRTYQAWYRNPASFCTPDGFNLTNGLRVTWLP